MALGMKPGEMRARTEALAVAVEEADESARWLRLLRDADLASGPDLVDLIREATELAAILGASCATAERNGPRRRT